MCGIAGAFAYGRGNGFVEPDALSRACDAMLARGPDGHGLWCSPDRKVGLAHRRLSIIDLSELGAQPMEYPEERLQITFNGEIYNYRELKASLEASGSRFRSGSDTEVLLHLYAKYGESMCEHLRGMFAFAIWDDRRQGLFLARDHFGMKPLYVGRRPGYVFFASQVRAILASKAIPVDVEPAGHIGFFIWGNVPQPYTLYKQIREVPAGHVMWIDEHGIREPRPFFDLSSEIAALEGQAVEKTREAACERLAEVTRDTIKHHFVADVPVGVFLSAGRDSTSILAVATEVNESPPISVTLGFEEYAGTSEDEVPLASAVAQQFGSKHLCQRVQGTDFRTDLERILKAMDQPTVDGLNTYFVSKVTSEFGVKVALSGLGADELLGGYGSFSQIPRLVNGLKAAKKTPWLGRAFRSMTAGVMAQVTSPKYAGLLEYGTTYGGAYLLRRGLFMPWELSRMFDPDMVRMGLQELQTLTRLDATVKSIKSDRGIVSSLEIQNYMRNRLLRDSDWAGMAHSLEIRVPFVDVEFFRAIAPFFGTDGQLGKADLARVPLKPLPDSVLNRPKTGFNIPVREWLMGEKLEAGSERSLRGWARMVYHELTKA